MSLSEQISTNSFEQLGEIGLRLTMSKLKPILKYTYYYASPNHITQVPPFLY